MNTTRTVPVHLPETSDKLADIPERAVNLAERLGKQTDRGMFALLLIVGLIFMAITLYWHREDQRAMATLFAETIKQNTEALTRSALALERLERKQP